jgi:mannose-6-phosphate isomerase-like protein (cupin superfamily)
VPSRHLVRRAADADYAVPDNRAANSGAASAWAAGAEGYRYWPVVGEHTGSPSTGFGICVLDGAGSVPAHVHSFEETFYVLDGTGVMDLPDGSFMVGPGDYGLVPVGTPHAWRNVGGEQVRWAQMQGPAPRAKFGDDTFAVPLAAAAPVPVDVRDPRNRLFGNITADHMNPRKQGQELLALSASMRTALLVYSGIGVKMMVDSDLGADLTTMFMVQYDPDGKAGQHDHPFDETYLILAGATDAEFDGERYRLEVGDIAWAGVGCVHGFANAGDGPVRWLETQSPQPPGRHSYRFARDWQYLGDLLSPPNGEGNG